MVRYLLTLTILSLAVSSATAQPLNVIFYGNSFTLGFGSTRSVNDIFEDIAVAAGHDQPLAQSAAASGQDLGWHVNNNTAPIFTSIPLDRDWDFIVMQEHSTKLTRAYNGSPPFPDSVDQSQSDAVALYDVATTRSPNVVPVLYETWARGTLGHEFFYTGDSPIFPGGPTEMQAEVRAGYEALKSAIDPSVNGDLARIAPVGDAWEVANYDRLHANDNWHAQNRGTLLAALVIYSTVYDDPTTSDIDLANVLTSLNLTSVDGAELTAAADATVPEPGPWAGLLAIALCIGNRFRRAA